MSEKGLCQLYAVKVLNWIFRHEKKYRVDIYTFFGISKFNLYKIYLELEFLLIEWAQILHGINDILYYNTFYKFLVYISCKKCYYYITH